MICLSTSVFGTRVSISQHLEQRAQDPQVMMGKVTEYCQNVIVTPNAEEIWAACLLVLWFVLFVLKSFHHGRFCVFVLLWYGGACGAGTHDATLVPQQEQSRTEHNRLSPLYRLWGRLRIGRKRLSPRRDAGTVLTPVMFMQSCPVSCRAVCKKSLHGLRPSRVVELRTDCVFVYFLERI